MKKKINKKNVNPFNFIKTFSKVITAVWVVIWVEVIIFSQIATIFSLGDATSIQVINDNAKEIGLVITGAYFGTKCFENLAKGYEEHQLRILGIDRADYEEMEEE